jgi:hypothetical protein
MNVVRCKSDAGEYIQGDFCVLDRFGGLSLEFVDSRVERNRKVVRGYQPDIEGWAGYTGNKRWINFSE